VKRFRVVAGVLAACVLAAASPVSAETMLDLYVGGAFTEDSTLEIDTIGFMGSLPADWRDSVVGGVRVGHWFGGPLKWFGLAADLSYFQPEVAGGVLELHLVPITPLVMVRIPLFADEGHEGGRLQPYAGVGPGLFTGVLTSNVTSGADVGFDAGLDIRAGVAVLLTGGFGLFAEYRRTDVDMKIGDIKTTVETDHISGGIALRF